LSEQVIVQTFNYMSRKGRHPLRSDYKKKFVTSNVKRTGLRARKLGFGCTLHGEWLRGDGRRRKQATEGVRALKEKDQE